MMSDLPATAELDVLLRHPVLRERWPDGFTTDDVLAELMELGRVAVAVGDRSPRAGDDPSRFTCRLELRDEPVGSVCGQGRTLTAAALRCLLEAEADLRSAVEHALNRLGDLLGER
jgi:hypothetical protein